MAILIFIIPRRPRLSIFNHPSVSVFGLHRVWLWLRLQIVSSAFLLGLSNQTINKIPETALGYMDVLKAVVPSKRSFGTFNYPNIPLFGFCHASARHCIHMLPPVILLSRGERSISWTHSLSQKISHINRRKRWQSPNPDRPVDDLD